MLSVCRQLLIHDCGVRLFGGTAVLDTSRRLDSPLARCSASSKRCLGRRRCGLCTGDVVLSPVRPLWAVSVWMLWPPRSSPSVMTTSAGLEPSGSIGFLSAAQPSAQTAIRSSNQCLNCRGRGWRVELPTVFSALQHTVKLCSGGHKLYTYDLHHNFFRIPTVEKFTPQLIFHNPNTVSNQNVEE